MKKAIGVTGLLIMATGIAILFLSRFEPPSSARGEGQANVFSLGTEDLLALNHGSLPGAVRGAHGDNAGGCTLSSCANPESLDCNRDTVCAFLGESNAPVAYHAPGGGDHLEPHLSSYFDSSFNTSTTNFSDDSTAGIDRGLLFFYAGHGLPDAWSTLDLTMQLNAQPFQNKMKLGNGTDGLRYLWHCSCRGLAHGKPRLEAGGNCVLPISDYDYSQPQEFQGNAKSQDLICMRNAYARWGKVFDTRLRMVCGGSTLIQCKPTQTDAIWRNYLRNELDVADSFILGLHTDSSRIGACLTRGGEDPAATPLLDARFKDEDRPAAPMGQREWLHLEYLQVEGEPALPGRPGSAPPGTVPKFTTAVAPPPANYILLREEGDLEFYRAPGLPALEIVRDKTEGALSVQGTSTGSIVARPATFDRAQAVQRAQGLVDQLGWGKGPNEPNPKILVVRLMIDSVPAQPAEGEMTRNRFQKSVVALFKRQVSAGNQLMTEVSSDGTIMVQLDAVGGLIRAWKLWKKIIPQGSEIVRVADANQKWREILRDKSELDTLVPNPMEWGYQIVRTPGGNGELRFFLRTTFNPLDEESSPSEFHQIIDLSANAQSVF